jgi:hypothetical protein
MVALVDGDHVGDLHDPGLERLDRVAGAGHEHEEDGVGDRDHLDLALAGAHGLEEDELLAGRIEQKRRLERRLGETAEVAARAHRADEDLGVEEVVREADAVAEEGALRERARGVDRDDADAPPVAAHALDERADQARLADARRAGDPDRVRVARLPVELLHELVRERVRALHQRDRAGEGAAVSCANAVGERLEGPARRH